MLKELFKKRVEDLRNYFKGKNADGLLLKRCDNFSWFTFGGRSHITLDTKEVGVASILITESKVYLFTDNIERSRLEKEELNEEILEELEIVEYKWFGEEYHYLKPYIENKKILSDTDVYDTINVNSEIAPFRYVLTEYEIQTYRELGKICDSIMDEEMRKLDPEMTELQVQGIFYKKLAENGIEPLLAIVFGEESAMLYRHNLSRNVKLGSKAFVSLCARKKGLVISITRSILFKKDESFIQQHKDNCYVDAVAMANSIPGRKLSDVFKDIKLAYSEVGKNGEWELHHQGGLAGYNSRELKATDNSDYILKTGNALAWNPTITGTKSEDTIVIKSNGFEILSYPENSNWPSLIFEINGKKVRRPDILVI
ncbi:MAG: hypothetical protein PWQ20_1138 [Thermotogaceae bacterium]|nr:hypothetical protein [Thermotogaceae bacterium]